MLSLISDNWLLITSLIGLVALVPLAQGITKSSSKSIRIISNDILSDDNFAIGSIIKSNISIGSADKPEWYEVLEEELKRFPIGKVVFNPPDTMKVGVRERLEVRISRDSNTNLVTALKGQGIAQIENIKVSELMKVRVSGSDFNIIQLNEEEQFVSSQEFTEWAWDITPKTSGKKVLYLHVTLRIKLPFGEEKKDHPVLDKKINVKINPVYSAGIFISIYWKWIATVLILPLVGLIWKTCFN